MKPLGSIPQQKAIKSGRCSPLIPNEMMEAYPVSTLVNSPANDRRECAEPFMQRWRPQPLVRSYKGYTISGSADRVYLRVACSDRCKTNPTKSANLPSGKEDSKSEVTDRNSMCSRSARPPQS